jgi:hypothetical protein
MQIGCVTRGHCCHRVIIVLCVFAINDRILCVFTTWRQIQCASAFTNGKHKSKSKFIEIFRCLAIH